MAEPVSFLTLPCREFNPRQNFCKYGLEKLVQEVSKISGRRQRRSRDAPLRQTFASFGASQRNASDLGRFT
jgi:hypothetical protein